MLAILQVLEAKHAVQCELCRASEETAGPPPTHGSDEDEGRPSPRTSPVRNLVSAFGLGWTDVNEAH